MPVNVDINEKVSICAIDGGTTSGVARGIFQRYADSSWEGLRNGSWESYEVGGPLDEQPWEIMSEYADWIEFGKPPKRMKKQNVRRHILVIEDFVIRLGTGSASKRELLDPVRVAHGCATLCLTRAGLRWAHPVYVQPNLAKNFATNERLRRHGFWVKGSEHRRDAVRHMCRAYASLLGETR